MSASTARKAARAGDWAEGYLGIPFVDRGLTRAGCDCWGLFRLILAEQCGIELPAYPEVAKATSIAAARVIAAEASKWQAVERGAERAFDAVLMRGMIEVEGRTHSRPVHIGCVVRPGALIHIEVGADVTVIDYRRHPAMRNRLVGFYRHASS